MLYVFQVDTGIMMTFGMKRAMDSVANLKKAIAQKTDIPEDKQVLLISGGDSLNNKQRVCSYSSAGTDTSPIFLFAKNSLESSQPPMPNVADNEDEADMTEVIESCLAMQPSLDTLVARTELAAHLYEKAIEQEEAFKKLVHDQHLQQQGWAAVTANLEDLTGALRNKSETLMSAIREFTGCKPTHKELLNKFGDDINHLNNIPVLPSLIENSNQQKLISSSSQIKSSTSTRENTDDPAQQQGTSSSSSSAVDLTQDKGSSTSSSSQISLRQWIDYHDSHTSLEKLVELCWRGIEGFTEANAEQLNHEVEELLKSMNNSSMKEIKGLEDRLFGLEKLMVDAKKVVQEQYQLSSSFQHNRESFSKIKDTTLLPDLSASHKEQLQMMLLNHQKMKDFRGRCLRAKHELSVNLHARLKWVMYIEQQISELDSKLMIYKENLVRLKKHLDVVKQVHKSPELYLESVVESLRRRRFTRGYLHWANSIAKVSQELYDQEMKARQTFDAKLSPHFLSSMFPGLARSYPPPFATVAPDPFDTKLPRITTADIQYLQSNLCDQLAEKLVIPNDVPMPHIISGSAPIPKDEGVCEKINEDIDDRHSLNPTPPSSPR